MNEIIRTRKDMDKYLSQKTIESLPMGTRKMVEELADEVVHWEALDPHEHIDYLEAMRCYKHLIGEGKIVNDLIRSQKAILCNQTELKDRRVFGTIVIVAITHILIFAMATAVMVASVLRS